MNTLVARIFVRSKLRRAAGLAALAAGATVGWLPRGAEAASVPGLDSGLLFPSAGAFLLVSGLLVGALYWRMLRRRRLPTRPTISAESVAAAQLDEFGVHFQPVINLATGDLVGAEALVRWEQPGAEVTTARQFFARAARAGVLDDVVARAMRPACDFARDCLDANAGAFRLHINLSESQLRAGDATVEVLERALRESQLVPWALQVEVPERALVEIGPGVTTTLKAIADLGVNIAIDDFWGQDETYWVLSIPGVTAVKLDLRANTNSETSRASLANAARIAQSRNLTVAAKRVESSFEMEFATDIGCTEVQGHAYGRPMEASEFRSAAIHVPPSTQAEAPTPLAS